MSGLGKLFKVNDIIMRSLYLLVPWYFSWWQYQMQVLLTGTDATDGTVAPLIQGVMSGDLGIDTYCPEQQSFLP
jgi:hypothetical protein